MADAVLSVVLGRLAAIAEEKIRGEVRGVRGVKKEVLKLSDKLKTVRNTLEDAESRGVKEKSVRGWLKKLEDTAYEMEDILDEWNYYAIDASLKEKEKEKEKEEEKEKEKVRCSFIPSSCLCFKKVVVRRDIAMKIQNVNASLDEILKEKDQFNFVINTVPTTAPRFEITSSIDLENVEGKDIEKNKDDIVGKLMNDGDTQIVCIVGMGGIGKTTLAQLVYNDSRVKDCFELTIWICVSDPFDVAGIARGIIESVGTESSPDTNRLETILEKLRKSISGKKFLLVLDDVWNEDRNKWEPLRINMNHGAPGSKILVTTRNERVATIMGTSKGGIFRPEQLTNEECWSLLRRISLHGKEGHAEFEDVGKKIAMKCKGLPLAVNVVGSILQFKNSLEEWENLLTSEIWELEEAEVELYPHLLLSYKELSPPLKLCFSYCAVYPKDHRIKVERLIQHWMAQGYLGSVTANLKAEHEGRDYFNNLAMRSLFQDFEKDDYGEQISSCKMHDIVHDFALSLRKNGRVEAYEVTKKTCQTCNRDVQPYRTFIWHKNYSPTLCDCLTGLRVYWINDKELFRIHLHASPQGIGKLIHLRWLDISMTVLFEKEMKTICKLYYLQSLSLASCFLREIPPEIGNLVHLRHLILSENDLKELPDNMFNLIELQTLLLEDCSLEEIPRKIGNLINLRHIDLSRNRGLKVLPESMYSLVKLQTLFLKECSLKEISWKIENLVELRHLVLWGNKKLEELPRNITKLMKLRTLWLSDCSLKEIPLEIGNLVKLRDLKLTNNKRLKELPESMYRLVELRNLAMEDCKYCVLPKGFTNLSGLYFLDWFIGGSGFNKFGLLKNFINLRGTLKLSISVSSNNIKELVEDAREAELKKKIHLHTLEFQFINERNDDEGECSSSSLWVDLIEALEPNLNLHTLTILSYMGSRLPHWITSPLNLVREIELSSCSEVSSLPAMGKLPNLELLRIKQMVKLKVVGVEWLGIRGREEGEVTDIPSSSSLVVFPKLTALLFEACNEWLEWEDITAEEEESSVVSVMPCLMYLCVYGCDGLNNLPHRLLHKVSSLKELNIRCSRGLIQCYGDKDGSPWRSISQNNPQLQLVT